MSWRHFAPGLVVDGRYLLHERIGSGAVGSVWRAEDRERAEEIALKIIAPIDTEGRISRIKVGRFLREAQAMVRLRSPHVVQVFDHGAIARSPEPHADEGAVVVPEGPASPRGYENPPSSEVDVVYIAMELLRGASLRTRLHHDTRLDAATTLRMMRHVGRAIALAHRRNIVHRDLKPANIFLCTAQGSPTFHAKVLDFGMVKSLGHPLAAGDLVKTELGRPLGTPFYMSPEQACGLPNVDHRSDLWAMGVIAFECLVGTRPFGGRSLAAIFAAITDDDVPVPSAHADVPAGFDGWFARAVRRDIQRRFQSVRTLIDELEEVLGPARVITATGVRHRDLGLGAASPAIDPAASRSDVTPPPDRTLRRAPRDASASFVGREAELDQMAEAIESHCRVLTLRGRAGIGKARTAREYGRRAAPNHPGGIWRTSLADVEDATGLWLALAQSLGVHLGQGAPARRVGRALRSLGPALVIVEDVDDVRPHVAAALAEWLSVAPEAHFIVTSRRALALPTERVIRLRPLAVPLSEDASDGLSDAVRFAATELLVRRAIAFDRTLLGAADVAVAFGALAARTQGNPLGLELLASQAEGLHPADMVDALDRRLRHDRGTTIIQPNQVLDRIIDWVMHRLSPPLRWTMMQLAVFRRGFTATAAEHVVDLGGWTDAPPVAGVLRHLVHRKLVRKGHDLTPDARFTLHPVVLKWLRRKVHDDDGGLGGAEDRPSAEERDALRRRHAHHYAEFGTAEAVTTRERRGGSRPWVRVLEEVENLRAALRFATEARMGRIAGASALALAGIEQRWGRPGAAARWLVGPARVAETPRAMRRRCLLAQSRALLADDRIDAATRSWERARELAAEDDAPGGEAEAWLVRGAIARARGDLSTADDAAARAAATADEEGDVLGGDEAKLTRIRWRLEADPTPREQATLGRTLAEIQRRFATAGATLRSAETLAALGWYHSGAGRPEAAEDMLGESLTRYRELGDRYREAILLRELGHQAHERGDADEALAQLTLSARGAAELGALELEARALATAASVLATVDRPDEAWAHLVEAEWLLDHDEASSTSARVAVRLWRGLVEFRLGAVEDARRSYAEATALAADGARLDPQTIDRRDRLRQRLGEA
ncbi:MAG: protein kinase [Myxococcota bacterium]